MAQLVIGGAIVEGDPEKDPAVPADTIYGMHTDRDRLRVQVSTD